MFKWMEIYRGGWNRPGVKREKNRVLYTSWKAKYMPMGSGIKKDHFSGNGTHIWYHVQTGHKGMEMAQNRML